MFEHVLTVIERFDRIIIHRHNRPDGDAMGSQIGLRELLRQNYPTKEVYTVGDSTGFFGFMEGADMDEIADEAYENALAIRDGGMQYEYLLLDGEIAGFAAYSLQPDHIYLDKLYLKKEFRGRHISSTVFDDLIAKYRLPIRLNVNQGNTLGMRAYQGRGFRIIETIDIPLKDGYVNRDYIMEKPVE